MLCQFLNDFFVKNMKRPILLFNFKYSAYLGANYSVKIDDFLRLEVKKVNRSSIRLMCSIIAINYGAKKT